MQICEHPDVWTDGSPGLDDVSGVSSSGSGFFSHLPWRRCSSRRWCHLDDLGLVGGVVESCRGFWSVPGPVQTVQGAEFWGLFVPCRRPRLFSWGGDNLNVVRHVGRLLDGCRSSCPAELLNDGDLIMLIDRVLEQRDRDTDRVTKVKGHADAEIVRVRQVRESDKLGKDAPDEAGGLILQSLMHVVSCLGVCRRWYPTIVDLHRFFIAISRVVVTAPDPPCCAQPRHAAWVSCSVDLGSGRCTTRCCCC